MRGSPYLALIVVFACGGRRPANDAGADALDDAVVDSPTDAAADTAADTQLQDVPVLDTTADVFDGGSCGTGDARWVDLGAETSRLDGDTPIETPSMTLHDGEPWVAFSESSTTGNDGYVMQWDGTEWSGVGAALGPNPGASWPKIVDIGGVVTVAWGEVDPSNPPEELVGDINVAQHVGGAWEHLGGPLSSMPGMTNAQLPQLAEFAGAAVVAWTEGGAGVGQFAFRRWSGSAWLELPAPAAGNAADIRLAGHSTRLTAMWWETTGGAGARVHTVNAAEFDGSVWRPLGTVASDAELEPSGPSLLGSITHPPESGVVVSYTVGAGTGVFMKRYSSAGWTQLPSIQDSLVGVDVLVEIQHAQAGSELFAAVAARGAAPGVYVLQLREDETGWEVLHAEPMGREDAFRCRVVVDDCGEPIVAWMDGSGSSRHLRVRRRVRD